MITFLIVLVHIVVSLGLIAVVLLQTGKRADLAGAFGGGGSQTAFGARGAATLLSKLTTTFAVLFMLTSISLSIVAARKSQLQNRSVVTDVPAETSAPVPGDGSDSGSLPVTEPDATPTEPESSSTDGGDDTE